MSAHAQWLAPAPLWDALLQPGGGAPLRAPALLRFARDDFMDEFMGVIAARPERLREYVAREETWRRPRAGLPQAPLHQGNGAGPDDAPLKLYQPVHGRFYLVAASLACRVPGLPEHTVDAAQGENVGFVLRRLVTDDDGRVSERAWLETESGAGWATGDAGGARLVPGEARLPMAGAWYAAEQGRRRVFTGLVPASRREAFVAGREVAAPGTVAPPPDPALPADDPRVVDFQRMVQEPWLELARWHDAEATGRAPSEEITNAVLPMTSAAKAAEAQVMAAHATALILLDLAAHLAAELPRVWDAVLGERGRGTLDDGERALYDALAPALRRADGGGRRSLREALVMADAARDGLERMALTGADGRTPDYPAGYDAVLLTGYPHGAGLGAAEDAAARADHAALRGLLVRAAGATALDPRPLSRLLAAALPATPAGPGAGGGGGPPRLPEREPLNAQGDDLYVVRCFYARPVCGPGAPAVVSERSAAFQLAGFFDADAPARPLRIALPVDTSPAALRRYDRNVAVVLSDELRRQIGRIRGMAALVDGEVGPAPSLNLSVVCSLSIPIITICALILLLVVVSLLNFVFRWVPFFMCCFPVPSLKAKE